MKTKQTKGAQAQENQEACVSAGRLTNSSQRRNSSQGQKIISLYHHRQKKEETEKAKDSRELCVVCGRETEYTRETPISQRRGYIEGAGQLCRRCFAEIYADGQL